MAEYRDRQSYEGNPVTDNGKR